MNIKIIKVDGGFQADCKDCPGSPPVGCGKTKEEAVAALFFVLMFNRPHPKPGPFPHSLDDSWLTYIKQSAPITINEKVWEDPTTKKRKLNKKEIAKGRSEGYWDMSAEDQWAEDKRLGILDWDGN